MKEIGMIQKFQGNYGQTPTGSRIFIVCKKPILDALVAVAAVNIVRLQRGSRCGLNKLFA